MSDHKRGSVKQAANGNWYYVVDGGELAPDGRPKRRQHRKRGFTSEAQALKALRGVLHDLDEQALVAPKRQTLAAFLTDTWLPAIEHTVKPSTFESYTRNIRLHVADRPIGRRQLQEVDGSALNKLYGLLLAGDGSHRPLCRRNHKACGHADLRLCGAAVVPPVGLEPTLSAF
jgi:integrase